MATIIVEYSVPVLAQVDTELGEVVAVDVADSELCANGKFFDEEGQPLSEEAAFTVGDRAYRIAHTTPWPRWRFG